MTTIDELLAIERDGATTRFDIGLDMHGAFGGAFGGIVAASMLVAARSLADDRRPIALDCRFLRGLPAGTAVADAEVVHTGRSLSAIDVRLTGPDGRLAATAAATFANADALLPLDVGESDAPLFAPAVSYDEATPLMLPAGFDAPIITTFAPRLAQPEPQVYAALLKVPWDDEGTGAEISCLAADMCTGAPVVAGMGEHRAPHPNPDLSVRFIGHDWVPEIAGIARLDTIAAGAAAMRFDVRAREQLVAFGQATSLLLDTGRTPN